MPPNARFKRGAKSSPRHKLLAASPFRKKGATAPQFLMDPVTLSYWLNDVDGCCVSSEECFKLACALLGVEVVITDATLQAWINQYGYADGATLTDVMDTMKTHGITQDGVTYYGGSYTGVDYSVLDNICNALCQGCGPVKIAIDANLLPSGAGEASGWVLTGVTAPTPAQDADHCINYCGFGPATWLAAQLEKQYGVTVTFPAGFDTTKMCTAAYTWKTIGIVDGVSSVNLPTEAWLRDPATVVNGQPVPYPMPGTPTPTPTPTPSPGKAMQHFSVEKPYAPGSTLPIKINVPFPIGGYEIYTAAAGDFPGGNVYGSAIDTIDAAFDRAVAACAGHPFVQQELVRVKKLADSLFGPQPSAIAGLTPATLKVMADAAFAVALAIVGITSPQTVPILQAAQAAIDAALSALPGA